MVKFHKSCDPIKSISYLYAWLLCQISKSEQRLKRKEVFPVNPLFM